MRHTPPSFYSADLAGIHAEAFAPMWDAAVPFLAGLAQVAGEVAHVVDLGCGDGRMLDMLRQHGVSGSGCDVSADFVALARRRCLQVEQCDAAHAHLPAATLVLALGEVLAYCDMEGRTALEAVAHAAWASLRPGGHLVFDLLGPAVQATQGWREGRDWLVASRTTVQRDRLEREIVAFIRTGTAWRRTEERHRQRLHDPVEIATLLAAIGYEVAQAERIGDAALLPGRFGVIARKGSRRGAC